MMKKKKMPKQVLTPEEKAVEEDRRKAQQANDLAANAKRSSLAGKKSKSNSKRFMGSPKNKSKISAGGQQHKSTVAGKKSYAAEFDTCVSAADLFTFASCIFCDCVER